MLSKKNLQLNDNGDLHHLLAIEGLPKRIIERILDTAESFVGINEREVKVVPLLRGKSIFNIFFENSTRTRTTFEIAAKRLSADVVSLDVARSSTNKGETILDTIANLTAMHADMFVVRHSESGAPYLIAQHAAPHVHVVNAGDGRHEHPTQGLLDMFTIRKYKKDFTRLTVDCGRHPALTRSTFADTRIDDVWRAQFGSLGRARCYQPTLSGGVRVFTLLEEGLKGVDVVTTLRLQNERMNGALLPSASEYFHCVTAHATKAGARET